jgi:CRP-like cAMP-binding protein
MISEFENYLRSYAGMDEENLKRITSLAIPKTLRRNEFLLQAGEVCRHKIFIVQGMLRAFSISDDGSEHILQFAPEYSWTLDVESYDKEIPAQCNIAAVEPSNVLMWNKSDFEELRQEVGPLKNFAQQLISRNIYTSRQRLLTMLSGTPEEKYNQFVREFPTLVGRLPLRMIASYLGVSLKTLTRIRHAQLHALK